MNISQKSATKSRSEQLIALLSRPNGVRASLICARFGWQPHSVRAAVSELRKKGLHVLTSKSAKSGETIYRCQNKVARLKGHTGSTSTAGSVLKLEETFGDMKQGAISDTGWLL